MAQEAGTEAVQHGVSGIRPPKNLTVSNDMATTWKEWLQHFNWYAIATQLDKKPHNVQAATLLATVGPDAIAIFNTFNLTNSEQNNIEVIKETFTRHFTPKSNLTYERYTFNKVLQKEGETFDEFLTSIKAQAKKCQFDNLHDRLVKDKIVMGIRSNAIREKLLTEPDLTLEQATSICRAAEQASRHPSSPQNTTRYQRAGKERTRKYGIVRSNKKNRSPIVIIRKNGKIRICIDPSGVNKFVLRRHHPLVGIEEIATRLVGSKYFTKLDCYKGFWQIPVTTRTEKYLTFATPWGRLLLHKTTINVINVKILKKTLKMPNVQWMTF